MLADLIDLVLPVSCVGCGRPGPPLCATCGEPDVHAVPLDGLAVVAATRYEGVVRTALLAYKERGRGDLRRPLARLLAAALSDVAAAPAAVVPMPTTPSARRARGGDHVLRLATVAARESGLGQVCTPLRLARAVRDSAGLDIAERAANLDRAMVRPAAPTLLDGDRRRRHHDYRHELDRGDASPPCRGLAGRRRGCRRGHTASRTGVGASSRRHI